MRKYNIAEDPTEGFASHVKQRIWFKAVETQPHYNKIKQLGDGIYFGPTEFWARYWGRSVHRFEIDIEALLEECAIRIHRTASEVAGFYDYATGQVTPYTSKKYFAAWDGIQFAIPQPYIIRDLSEDAVFFDDRGLTPQGVLDVRNFILDELRLVLNLNEDIRCFLSKIDDDLSARFDVHPISNEEPDKDIIELADVLSLGKYKQLLTEHLKSLKDKPQSVLRPSFLLVSGLDEKIQEEGIKTVFVNKHYEEVIRHLQMAYSKIKFKPFHEIGEFLTANPL